MWACQSWRLEIIKYLIFDHNLKKTKGISDFFKANKDDDFVAQAKEMFLVRDLKKSLSNSLNSGENKSKIKL